ncbi:hypothetical protein QYE76_037997 [Lolium multiflorum]|uniref:Transposase-associated domain-containing protein n=1 Tax=Lolium multiflorum TaxID=4521 RepID=A0AAD8WQU3_LOLMU|nr:hypothetical protein QYE76_037997 [Lolium multiflorum]
MSEAMMCDAGGIALDEPTGALDVRETDVCLSPMVAPQYLPPWRLHIEVASLTERWRARSSLLAMDNQPPPPPPAKPTAPPAEPAAPHTEPAAPPAEPAAPPAEVAAPADDVHRGVNSFLLVAEANKSEQGFMCCPCLKCKNEKDYSCSRDIKSHLLRFGFMSSYNVWTKHGEEGVMMEDGDEEEDNDDQYRSMFSECDDTAMDDNEEEGGEEQASDDPVDDDLRRAISDARRDCGTDK